MAAPPIQYAALLALCGLSLPVGSTLLGNHYIRSVSGSLRAFHRSLTNGMKRGWWWLS